FVEEEREEAREPVPDRQRQRRQQAQPQGDPLEGLAVLEVGRAPAETLVTGPVQLRRLMHPAAAYRNRGDWAPRLRQGPASAAVALERAAESQDENRVRFLDLAHTGDRSPRLVLVQGLVNALDLVLLRIQQVLG